MIFPLRNTSTIYFHFTFLYTYFESEAHSYIIFLNILQCSFCSNLKGIRTEMNRQEDPGLTVFLFCREINNFTKKFLCNFPGPDWTGWAQGRWWWPSLAAAVNLWVLQEGPGRTRRREEAGLMQSPDRRTALTAVSSGVLLGISHTLSYHRNISYTVLLSRYHRNIYCTLCCCVVQIFQIVRYSNLICLCLFIFNLLIN